MKTKVEKRLSVMKSLALLNLVERLMSNSEATGEMSPNIIVKRDDMVDLQAAVKNIVDNPGVQTYLQAEKELFSFKEESVFDKPITSTVEAKSSTIEGIKDLEDRS